MLKRFLTGFAAVLMLPGAAVAGPFEDGHAAEQRGDYVEAAKWYRLAADQRNDRAAQFKLGVMLLYGRGVPQDYVLAHLYLNLAAAAGFVGADLYRNTVERKMSDGQLAEAQHLARDWKPSP